MNFWSIVIYGVAAAFAIQGLLALMTAHRNASLRRFLDEESQQDAAARQASDAEQDRTKAA